MSDINIKKLREQAFVLNKFTKEYLGSLSRPPGWCSINGCGIGDWDPEPPVDPPLKLGPPDWYVWYSTWYLREHEWQQLPNFIIDGDVRVSSLYNVVYRDYYVSELDYVYKCIDITTPDWFLIVMPNSYRGRVVGKGEINFSIKSKLVYRKFTNDEKFIQEELGDEGLKIDITSTHSTAYSHGGVGPKFEVNTFIDVSAMTVVISASNAEPFTFSAHPLYDLSINLVDKLSDNVSLYGPTADDYSILKYEDGGELGSESYQLKAKSKRDVIVDKRQMNSNSLELLNIATKRYFLVDGKVQEGDKQTSESHSPKVHNKTYMRFANAMYDEDYTPVILDSKGNEIDDAMTFLTPINYDDSYKNIMKLRKFGRYIKLPVDLEDGSTTWHTSDNCKKKSSSHNSISIDGRDVIIDTVCSLAGEEETHMIEGNYDWSWQASWLENNDIHRFHLIPKSKLKEVEYEEDLYK